MTPEQRQKMKQRWKDATPEQREKMHKRMQQRQERGAT
jgi:Spy/CpxP family protein refolding chaperone